MHGDQPLRPLLDDVLARVDVPVLAAGGLATGHDLADVLDAGAAGARLGTRFVATEESGAHPLYKQAIVDATAEETALVTDFSVLWPNGPEPHRVLTRALDAARRSPDVIGEAPGPGGRMPVPRFAVLPPTAACTGDIEAFAMYAGTSVGAIHSIEPAAVVLARIAAEAEAQLASA